MIPIAQHGHKDHTKTLYSYAQRDSKIIELHIEE